MTDGSTPVPPTPPLSEVASPPGLHATLSALGWQQGSKLPAALVSQVVWSAGAAVPDTDQEVAVFVVSQDCDVLHDSIEHEPLVEVMAATVIAPADVRDRYKHVRHPRMLHLPVKRKSKTVGLALRVLDRGVLPRSELAKTGPCGEIRLDERTTRRLAVFVARRYIRTARPDELDKRLGKVLDNLAQLLITHAEILDDIYLAVPLDQHRELGATESYACSVCAVVSTK